MCLANSTFFKSPKEETEGNGGHGQRNSLAMLLSIMRFLALSLSHLCPCTVPSPVHCTLGLAGATGVLSNRGFFSRVPIPNIESSHPEKP